MQDEGQATWTLKNAVKTYQRATDHIRAVPSQFNFPSREDQVKHCTRKLRDIEIQDAAKKP